MGTLLKSGAERRGRKGSAEVAEEVMKNLFSFCVLCETSAFSAFGSRLLARIHTR